MKYSVTQNTISDLLTWIKIGEIAIPEIQRPFVWNATKVRNLLDSLYQGYPVGYLIAWQNPTVKLKDGSSAAGKKILIDGQQRVTALMAALLGQEIVKTDYSKARIRIAFDPQEQKFEVLNQAIRKDNRWIQDVAEVFAEGASLFRLVDDYCAANPNVDKDEIFKVIEKLKNIVTSNVGLIQLHSNLDIETVTEIFIRVNSAGVTLNQADFAMSKIATNESYGGNTLRKAIDYFCHLIAKPEFYDNIKANDPDFAETDYFSKMAWTKNFSDDIYEPSYTDMLRVAFTSEFKRGQLEDLVALLSGRNFATKQFEEAIAEDSFGRLKAATLRFINKDNFNKFVMIVRSAGFIDSSLIGSQNALNFAYIVYLTLREEGQSAQHIEKCVRRWFVFTMLTGRYSSSPESKFDTDIRQIRELGFDLYSDTVFNGELSDTFWRAALPQSMNTSSASSPYFRVFRAAQVKMKDEGFLSRDITAADLIATLGHVHHLYPADYLKKNGMSQSQYNQIANYALTQSEINIAISNKAPAVYFNELAAQCANGPLKYGAITDINAMKANLKMHCIPITLLDGQIPDYMEFLAQRRHLMAEKLRDYFALL